MSLNVRGDGYGGFCSADVDTGFFSFHEAGEQHAVRRLMRDSVPEFSVPLTNRSAPLNAPLVRHLEAMLRTTAGSNSLNTCSDSHLI